MRELRKAEKQWLFDYAALQNTPSMEAGITFADELRKRVETINFIKSLCYRTGLSGDEDKVANGGRAKVVMNTASTLVHRFYMRRSFQDFPPTLIAPTVLFIASKIEEEPIKLRFLVNICLVKFDGLPESKQWVPMDDHGNPAASPEYQKWEKEILAVEEIVHEALCFDMIVDDPWTLFSVAIQGLDEMWTKSEEDQLKALGPSAKLLRSKKGDDSKKRKVEKEEGEVDDVAESRTGKEEAREEVSSKRPLSEDKIREYASAFLSELLFYPLVLLYHPIIIAFSTFCLISCLHLNVDLKTAMRLGAEVAWKFGLDLQINEDQVHGSDYDQVNKCIRQILDFARLDLRIPKLYMLKELGNWSVEEDQRKSRKDQPYSNHFHLRPPSLEATDDVATKRARHDDKATEDTPTITAAA